MLGLLNVLKVIVIMVTELSRGKVEMNMLENGKMAKDTDKVFVTTFEPINPQPPKI